MQTFRYTAVARSGELANGTLEAANLDAVFAQLSAVGHFPIEAAPVDGAASPAPAGKKPIGTKRLARLTADLARITAARVPLERGLDILSRTVDHAPTRGLVDRLLTRLRAGDGFAAALDAEGPPFTRLYIAMVRAGEAGGSLDDALARLAQYLEAAVAFRSKVTTAMIYPVILLVASLGSLAFLLTYVVPQFEALFAQAEAQLPYPTRVVLAASALVQAYWWLIPGMVLVAAIGLPQLAAWSPARRSLDRAALALPILGGLIGKLEVARFTRTLAALTRNGVTLLPAIGIARETVANTAVRAAVDGAAVDVEAGLALADALADRPVVPATAVHMLKIGEETGQLPEMLADVATIYERDAEETLKKLIAWLEPVIILGLGLLVAGIILSILAAIIAVNQLAF